MNIWMPVRAVAISAHTPARIGALLPNRHAAGDRRKDDRRDANEVVQGREQLCGVGARPTVGYEAIEGGDLETLSLKKIRRAR